MKYSDKSLYFCKFRKFHLGAWGPSNNSFLNTFGRKNKGWVILITAHHEGRRPIRTSIYYAELYNKVLNLIKFPSETRWKAKKEKNTGNLSSKGGFICTFSLLISLSITLRTSKFRNHFTISSKYFDMVCYLKRETFSGPISFEVQRNDIWTDNIQSFDSSNTPYQNILFWLWTDLWTY